MNASLRDLYSRLVDSLAALASEWERISRAGGASTPSAILAGLSECDRILAAIQDLDRQIVPHPPASVCSDREIGELRDRARQYVSTLLAGFLRMREGLERFKAAGTQLGQNLARGHRVATAYRGGRSDEGALGFERRG